MRLKREFLGGLPYKSDGGARRKFSEKFPSTRIHIFGHGSSSFLPQKWTNVDYFIDKLYMTLAGQESCPRKREFLNFNLNYWQPAPVYMWLSLKISPNFQFFTVCSYNYVPPLLLRIIQHLFLCLMKMKVKNCMFSRTHDQAMQTNPVYITSYTVINTYLIYFQHSFYEIQRWCFNDIFVLCAEVQNRSVSFFYFRANCNHSVKTSWHVFFYQV